MARKVTEEVVCDFCGAPATKGPYTVSLPGHAPGIVDLCVTHAKPFERALQVTAKRPDSRAERRTARLAHQVEPFDWSPPAG